MVGVIARNLNDYNHYNGENQLVYGMKSCAMYSLCDVLVYPHLDDESEDDEL